MTVKVIYGLDEDRKPELNGNVCKARYYIPHILRINFIDDKTGTILFTYVPKLEEEKTLTNAFTLLKEYDKRRMELYEFIKANELKK